MKPSPYSTLEVAPQPALTVQDSDVIATALKAFRTRTLSRLDGAEKL